MSETWSADVVGVKQSKMCESTKLINLPKAEVAWLLGCISCTLGASLRIYKWLFLTREAAVDFYDRGQLTMY